MGRVAWTLAAMSLIACGTGSDATAGGDDGSSGNVVASTSGTSDTPTPSTSTSDASDSAAGSSSGVIDSTDASSSSSTSSAPTEGSSSSGARDEVGPFESCYEGVFVNGFPGVNYDGIDLEIASHCLGTNYQDIDDVERVVFLGDSVTVGTPPTLVADYYRSILADALADRFALSFGSNKGLWQTPNPFEGVSFVRESGDFASCAEWGARTDDLIAGNQFEDCYPEDTRDLTTLTIITAGGNDLARIAQESGDGAPASVSWELAESTVEHMRESVEWLKDPQNFPEGHHVVFANVYEFTDGTGQVEACELSGLAGFAPLTSIGDALLVIGWIEDQYARLAQDTGSDMVFMFEEFAGHGFSSENPIAPGYRGPGHENWFDLTCIHPTPTGHGSIADMFLATVSE